jgi:transcriptional regulator with PAS, ATPase and Fis domain
VLIIGATGTGKEIIAHSIHNLSRRARGPFVSINCGAISGDLLESELFGYEEGAFTGSRRGGKAGLFELAHNGTIFLDEIGDAPKRVQTRLLRVIQEKEIMRIGGDCLIPVNVRIIAATNKDLNNEVASGRFREDLFFRLNILHLFIPPLRDRIEDLPLLISRLICRKARKNQLLPVTVPQRCLDQLARLDWPGNVRQLSNFLDRLIILCEGTFSDKIFNELFTELVEYSLAQPDAAAKPPAGLKNMMKEKSRGEEARIILTAFEACGFNKDLTAKHLGISRTTLWRKLKALDSE